jgi:hypothetical protein
MQIPGAYATPTVIGQVQRGNTFFNNTSGGNMLSLTNTAATVRGTTTTIANSANTQTYASFGASSGIINQDTFSIRNNAATTTYGAFTSTGTTITGAGLHQMTRTTVGTPGSSESRPSFNIQLSRSDQAAPANLDGTGFRYRVNGSNGTNYTIADMSANYNTGGDNVWTLFLANGEQTGATFDSLATIQSKISQTTIAAGPVSATPGGSSASTVATFAPTQTYFASGGTTYANFASGSAQITNSGRTTITRTTPGTGLLLTQQTVNADPANGDSTDFRLGVTGTSTNSNFARIDATYRSSSDHELGFSVSTDSFTADTDRIYIGSRAQTQIRATPAGGGSASDIMVISDAKILNNRPHRGAVTTATVARGTTYTPAAGTNNFIELTLTAGTDPTYIDVDNLTVAGEGGHQAILVYNNSGSSIGNGDLVIRNNGTQINDIQSTVANGSRVIFTVYCVGNYASCEYMHAA